MIRNSFVVEEKLVLIFSKAFGEVKFIHLIFQFANAHSIQVTTTKKYYFLFMV